MRNLIDLFLSSTSAVSVTQALLTIALAVILGLAIAAVYRLTTHGSAYSENFFTTLIFVPAIIAVIILLIGSNVARAFSLAGAFSIIRFRSAPGSPKDITYVLFSLAAGLACGVGGYVYALIFTLILCLLMVIFSKIKLGSPKSRQYTLKITIPENLNFADLFDDILSSYTKSFSLDKIKTADLGSVFELSYTLTMPYGANLKAFMDEIRCRNGNLTVLLALTTENKEF